MSDEELERINGLPIEGRDSPQRADNFHQHITVIPPMPDRVGVALGIGCGLMAGWLLHDLARFLGWT